MTPFAEAEGVFLVKKKATSFDLWLVSFMLKWLRR